VEYARNLSKNLRAIRGFKTQVAFSGELGITKSTLQSLEKGTTSARLDTLELISSRLGIPVSVLLTDELTPVEHSVLLHILRGMEWYTALSPNEQNSLLEWLQETLSVFSNLSDRTGD